jgi:calcineurin-like phosphoesterase family protein
MRTFFTADTHFGHESIIALAGRPFASLAAMDEALVANWNAVVGRVDRVFHLGDFCFRASLGPAHYRDRLNGEIHLIAGNHDDKTIKHHAGLFASIDEIREVKVEGQRLLLCHYPMREWPGAWRGVWHLFGHVHGRLDRAPLGLSLDVGVDSHDFRPIPLAAVAARLAGRVNPFGAGADGDGESG